MIGGPRRWGMGEGTSICRGGEQDGVGSEDQGVEKEEREKKKKGRASEAGENMTMEIRRREEGEVMEREERK